MGDFIARKCPQCNEPKNKLSPEGQEIILRCLCDWERGFHERVRATVHRDFWEKGKRLIDWSPAIFGDDRSHQFKSLIRIQKAFAMQKINNFCFAQAGERSALEASVDQGRTLFVRGPINSGRGLLVSSIKTFAAVKEISTTPLPSEWATMKGAMIESESFGKQAEVAKDMLAENLRDVSLMVIENIRSENGYSLLSKEPILRRFKSSAALDDVLIRRRGAAVLSSLDFAGHIGESLGDKLSETLASDRTDLLLLLSGDEADCLLRTLIRKHDHMQTFLNAAQPKDTKNMTRMERLKEGQGEERLMEALYFKDAFRFVPSISSPAKVNANVTILDVNVDRTPETEAASRRYEEEKKENGQAYRDNMDRTRALVVRECKELSWRLTERECIEIGRMMGAACEGEQYLNKEMKKARELRAEMSGTKDA